MLSDISLNRITFTKALITRIKEFIIEGEVDPDEFAHNKLYHDFVRLYSDQGWKIKKGELFYNERMIIPVEKKNAYIERYYKDPLTTGSAARIHEVIKRLYIGVSFSDVSSFLRGTNTTINTPQRQMKVRRPIVSTANNNHWQADLIMFDEPSIIKLNNGYRYVLTVIDVFSKYAWVQPMKNKESKTVLAAFEKILDQAQATPVKLQTDNGSEFLSVFHERMKTLMIHHIYSLPYAPKSNGVIERFNKTLKQKIYFHQTQYNTKRWVDVLDLLVKGYNDTIHSTTRVRPVALFQSPNTKFINKLAQDNIIKRAEKVVMASKRAYTPLKKGDYVRLSYITDSNERKATFRKQKNNQFSKEVYIVNTVSKPINEYINEIYTVNKLDGTKVNRRLYRDMLLKINKPLDLNLNKNTRTTLKGITKSFPNIEVISASVANRTREKQKENNMMPVYVKTRDGKTTVIEVERPKPIRTSKLNATFYRAKK